MNKFHIIAIMAILAALIVPTTMSESSDGASEQAKLVVYMDGDLEYYASFFAEGLFHIPPSPDHDNVRFIGWSLDGEIIDVSTFDFNTLPQHAIVLYAEYEDAPGRLSESTMQYIVATIIAVIILVCVAVWCIRRHD